MNENLKFKPGQVVFVQDVRNASAVGYLGTWHKVYDYIKHPEFLKHETDGTPIYPCVSEMSGYFTWFYEDFEDLPE